MSEKAASLKATKINNGGRNHLNDFSRNSRLSSMDNLSKSSTRKETSGNLYYAGSDFSRRRQQAQQEYYGDPGGVGWEEMRNVYPYVTYCYRGQKTPIVALNPYMSLRRFETPRELEDARRARSSKQRPALNVYRIFDDTGGIGAYEQNVEPPLCAGHVHCATCVHSCAHCTCTAAVQHVHHTTPYSTSHEPTITEHKFGPPPTVYPNAIPIKTDPPTDCFAKRRKKILFGTLLAITAVIVLGLAIALFVQIRRDAAKSSSTPVPSFGFSGYRYSPASDNSLAILEEEHVV